MKKKTKLLSAILALILLASCVTFAGVSADAAAVEIDGINTAFVSAFGKLVYKSQGYTAFKSFDKAYEAIGNGGRVVISGDVDVPNTLGFENAPLMLEGIGSRAIGNAMKPENEADIELAGDVTLDNVAFKSHKGGITIKTNGKNFYAPNLDVTYTIINNETQERSYSGPMNVDTGAAENAYTLELGGGYFTDVRVTGASFDGESTLNIASGEFDCVSVGAVGGKTNGDFTVNISGGSIKELRVGAIDGNFDGNIYVNITGGYVEKLICGAADGEKLSGNVTVMHSAGELARVSDETSGSVSGVITYALSSYHNIEIGEKLTKDYLVYLDNGTLKPAFKSGKFTGFEAFDEFGVPAAKIISGIDEYMPKDGVFTLPKGEFRARIVPEIDLAINDGAKFVTGYADGSFLPQNNITRAEAITLLTRIISDEEYVKKTGIESTFADVAPDAWYSSNIGFFEAAGLLEAVADGENFYPDTYITRGEFVQLIYNIEKTIGEKDTYAELCKLVYNVSANIGIAEQYYDFSDVDYANKYDYAVYHAVANGYVTGYADGSFAPDGNITRAEVVTVVNRVLGRHAKDSTAALFTDTASHWANGQISAAVGEYDKMGADGLAADGSTVADYIVKLMANDETDLVITMANNVYKKALAATASYDITAEQKEVLKAALELAKVTSRTEKDNEVQIIAGSAGDVNTFIYTDENGIFVREAHIASNKPDTEPVEIVQISDVHFNYYNKRDIAEDSPDLMSTRLHRTWLANAASTPFARKVMNYARFADQTVLTGDILDALSWGAIEKMNEFIFRIDTDVLVSLGNHEYARQVEGKVPSTMSYAEMEVMLQENWLHNIFYESKVIKDKVMVVVLDNGAFKYREEQKVALEADIKKARANGYIILIFQHIPICTNNPEDTAVEPLRLANGVTKDFYNEWIGNASTVGVTLEVYNLITQNADVVRGVFCGHLHGDYYTEIKGSYTDADGNTVESVIPQYVLMSAAFDNNKGHVMKITVE